VRVLCFRNFATKWAEAHVSHVFLYRTIFKQIMNWKTLDNIDQLEQIKQSDRPNIIFKHSTRCSISSMAKNRLERSWEDEEMEGVDFYYLDLIRYRDISNAIAQQFGIDHESPQVLVIKDGTCIYDESHGGISYDQLKETAR
jgi:bacillithiol system protein YtxJ